ncbi:MAG: flippase-like domain-containing protein [Myxococcales bacterium]|nr:MAG: flippase-like domain-containing protein [Myxococcales bacterium]
MSEPTAGEPSAPAPTGGAGPIAPDAAGPLAPTVAVPGARRRAAGHALKVALSAVLLAALARKVPAAELRGALASFSPLGLLLGLALTATQVVVGAQRWRRLLRRTGVAQPLGALLADTLIAAAYTMILPSSVGGDVVRALRCARRLDAPQHAWSTVFFERMVGFPCLALLAAPGVLVLPGGRALLGVTVAAALLGAVGLIVARTPLRWASRQLIARAPHLASLGGGVADDLQGPLGTAGARAEALLWTLLYQAAGISILAAVVLPSGDPRLVGAVYAGVPLIVIGAMAPVSLGGIGLRESLFVLVLGRLGVPEATALALGLLWLGTYFLLALPGVALVLADRRQADRS